MKDLFPEYYRPSDEEFRKLWNECIFVLDANILLNIYGYSETTREQLLALLERLASRIRMPHQFALEYQRNRAKAIMEQVKNYANAEKALTDLYNEEFIPKHKHPFLSDEMLTAFKKIQEDLATSRKKHESFFMNDPYYDRVTVIIKKVSSKPDDIGKLYENAKRRYNAKIPPGYADLKEKGEPDGYGDYIGWVQIIEISKNEKKPVILLTDDAKEDWWQIQGDRTIGPRPELIAEFVEECQQHFYMYSSDRFMKFAAAYLSEKVEPEAIEEVKERLKEQLRSVSDSKPSGSTFQNPSADKPLNFSEKPKPENTKPVAAEADLKLKPQPAEEKK